MSVPILMTDAFLRPNGDANATDRADIIEMLHKHGDTIAGVVNGRLGVNHPALRQLRR